jgi:hypothetical protein
MGADDYSQTRLAGQVFGVVVWVAVAAGTAILGAAGAPDASVALFALLAVLGLVVIALRPKPR